MSFVKIPDWKHKLSLRSVAIGQLLTILGLNSSLYLPKAAASEKKQSFFYWQSPDGVSYYQGKIKFRGKWINFRTRSSEIFLPEGTEFSIEAFTSQGERIRELDVHLKKAQPPEPPKDIEAPAPIVDIAPAKNESDIYSLPEEEKEQEEKEQEEKEQEEKEQEEKEQEEKEQEQEEQEQEEKEQEQTPPSDPLDFSYTLNGRSGLGSQKYLVSGGLNSFTGSSTIGQTQVGMNLGISQKQEDIWIVTINLKGHNFSRKTGSSTGGNETASLVTRYDAIAQYHFRSLLPNLYFGAGASQSTFLGMRISDSVSGTSELSIRTVLLGNLSASYSLEVSELSDIKFSLQFSPLAISGASKAFSSLATLVWEYDFTQNLSGSLHYEYDKLDVAYEMNCPEAVEECESGQSIGNYNLLGIGLGYRL